MDTKFDIYRKQIIKNKFIYLFKGKKYLVMKYYIHNQGYKYDINNPITFTEKVNSRKIEKNKLYSLCADKIRVREYVKDKIGAKYLIPSLMICKKFTDSMFDKLPNQFVIKTASGSGTIEVVKDKNKIIKKEFLKLIKKYQKVDFAFIWGEMFYKKIKNDIIIEELLLDKNGKIPNDYKIHCFNNNGDKKFFIQVEIDRFGNRARNIYDENFNLLPIKTGLENGDYKIKKPKKLKELLQVADKLSSDFKYVRVDLYYVNDRIYFGELTFTPAAGFSKFNDEKYNKLWGEYWR